MILYYITLYYIILFYIILHYIILYTYRHMYRTHDNPWYQIEAVWPFAEKIPLKSRPGQTSRLVAEWKSKLLHLGFRNSSFAGCGPNFPLIQVSGSSDLGDGLFQNFRSKHPTFQGEGRIGFFTSMGLPNISYWKFHQHLGFLRSADLQG